jgi:hypothetical protein
MTLILAVVGCLALFLGWAALPLLPSLIEARRRTDVKPLRVVRVSDVDIRHFATAFQSWVEGHLAGALAACRASGGPIQGELDDGIPYVVLPDGASPALTTPPTGPASCKAVVLGCGNLTLPPRTLFPLEAYAAGDVEVGEQSVCRAVLAGGDLRLGRGCWSLRWLHARAALLARESCALHGRASADGSMRLEEGCRFERLHAPTVAFGEPVPPTTPAPKLEPYTASDVPGLVEDAAGRWLVQRRLEIPARRLVKSDLVVTGDLRIGAGTRVAGSVKSHGDLTLAEGVVVDGSVVAGRDLSVGRGCDIRGPIVAERDGRFEAGTQLGSAQHPTTLSVRCLEIAAGCVAHGTVWAHGGGLVLPRPGAADAAAGPRKGSD